MVIFPLFTIRSISDWRISRSEKPAGESTKLLRLAMPVLTSRLSLRSVYRCDALRITSGIRLASHTIKNRMPVHVQTGTSRILMDAALAKASIHRTNAAATNTIIVRAIACGRTQGLPVQTIVAESFELADKFETCYNQTGGAI